MPALLLVIGLLLPAAARASSPYIWDQDGDHVDDRMQSVHVLGYAFSFENGDTLLRQRFDVVRAAGDLLFGAYVVYDHVPTALDLAALTAIGMPVLYRYEALPAVRSAATFAQVQAAAALPGVDRVEAVPLLYPMLRENAASAGVRDESERVFPTWEGGGGGNGDGIVIAFLDTGVNDVADGSVPAHESVAETFVGGATFLSPDSTLDTPRNGSMNPADHGGSVTTSHATHVAGIALGRGGPGGYARGIAPGARLVDVKVLSDAGSGTGVCEALDWCIHNRARNWGVQGVSGIQVINLSLSSPDASDGRDFASRLASRAVELGMVVVASMGNDGLSQHVPSPAAGDGVLAVGAYDSQRTPEPGDDQFSPFSNRGPRADDGDGSALDELKPDLLAPGTSVLSANGDALSDGHQYRRLSGTSMSAAFVSGAAACLRSAYPAMTPADIANLMRATGRREIASLPAGPAGADPRWQAARGFGALDLYAARLEHDQPGRTQVEQLALAGSGDSLRATVRTQRERGTAFLAIERAPDAGGAPGTFAGYDSVATSGDSSLASAINRRSYARAWVVPAFERGQAFWYRVAYTEGGVRWQTASRRVSDPLGASAATVEFSIVHNAYDHDVSGEVVAGEVSDAAPPSLGGGSSLSIPLPGSSAAVSSDWVDGVGTTGNIQWTFRVDFPASAVAGVLPADATHPWRLHVIEGGYLNDSGRITACRLVWHTASGDVVSEGGPVPQQTIEGGETVVAVPNGVTAVGGTSVAARFRVGPNPARDGQTVRFRVPGLATPELRVFDIAGREQARLAVSGTAAERFADWSLRDASGRVVPPGLYLVRAGDRPAGRLVVVSR